MQIGKKNILILGTHDSILAGHPGAAIKNIPAEYNVRLITYESLYGVRDYAFHNATSKVYKIYRKVRNACYKVKKFFKYGEFVRVDKTRPEYCFLSFDDKCISADRILSKLSGFTPDIISIMWVASFVSPKTIYDLYQKTQAKIVIHFIDEAPLAGGCHYHCDCDGYERECNICPALKSGKILAHEQMVCRNKYLSDIPLIMFGPSYDLEKAVKVPAYKNAKFKISVGYPKINFSISTKGRLKYGISENDFVIFIGAASLKDVRKGFKYSIESIREFAKDKNNVVVIALGKEHLSDEALGNVDLIQPGFLKLEEMMEALAMANVFLSTTIADSGPYMVNYAFYVGVPVVSFDLGIAHTLVKDKKTGCFATYKDSKSVAKGLEYIYYLSADERAEMSQQVKAEIEKYKDIPCWVNRLNE